VISALVVRRFQRKANGVADLVNLPHALELPAMVMRERTTSAPGDVSLAAAELIAAADRLSGASPRMTSRELSTLFTDLTRESLETLDEDDQAAKRVRTAPTMRSINSVFVRASRSMWAGSAKS
jgi:hypothetical protein